jgi:hypothetical protein
LTRFTGTKQDIDYESILKAIRESLFERIDASSDAFFDAETDNRSPMSFVKELYAMEGWHRRIPYRTFFILPGILASKQWNPR